MLTTLPPFFRLIIPSATIWLTLITAFTFTANDLQQKRGKAPEVDSVLHITLCCFFLDTLPSTTTCPPHQQLSIPWVLGLSIPWALGLSIPWVLGLSIPWVLGLSHEGYSRCSMQMSTDIYLVPRFKLCDPLIPFHFAVLLHTVYAQEQEIIKYLS